MVDDEPVSGGGEQHVQLVHGGGGDEQFLELGLGGVGGLGCTALYCIVVQKNLLHRICKEDSKVKCCCKICFLGGEPVHYLV